MNCALSFDSGQPFETIRNDPHPKVRFALRPRAGMTSVLRAFIDNIDLARRERGDKFFAHCFGNGHAQNRSRPRIDCQAFHFLEF